MVILIHLEIRHHIGNAKKMTIKILLKEDILSTPYIFEAIGEPTTLYNALNQAGGIVSRIKEANTNLKLQLEKVDVIILFLIFGGLSVDDGRLVIY